ncbi:glycine oxidase [Agrobacterium larrymoorei]|uniref:Glycine oxidase n=1 Tax=Agrobacterium larrymoorei TaxID=160699 RepID=A0AAJ2BBN8_9HYPH|nr:glycine oxidase ThiO [Agrobacterium larrymoorei]MDR6103470.1 glycine oxidase [Agrobacterium larrymoorei]
MRILLKGAGVAGLTAALELTRRGFAVAVFDTAPQIGRGASWFAGGMLAPWCERESAEQAVLDLGQAALDWWDEATPGLVSRHGTLVVAPARDREELSRFALRTSGYRVVGEDEIAALEPDLAGRFRHGLFFEGEGHLDPRLALAALYRRLLESGVVFHLGGAAIDEGGFDRIVDCTGHTQVGSLSGLRGVRGEMLYLATQEVSLSRPVRLLHPRIPLYIVPREPGRFMLGATMIETEAAGPISARSMMEFLNAAYALHPSFGEAQIIESGTGIRPAFPDNLPRIVQEGKTLFVNGAHRHGFLLSPAMARQAADFLQQEEVSHADPRQRRSA